MRPASRPDPIDLIHHSTGLSGTAMFEEAARQARLDRPAPRAITDGHASDHSHEIARIIAGCVPIAGTVAERYLHEPRTARSRLLRTCCSTTI